MDAIQAATVLGIPPTATPAEAQAAYRRLSKELHPDQPNGSHERMQALNEAYSALKSTKTKLPPSEEARLRRELRIVEQKLATVDATVVTWSQDDYRIPLMRTPLEKERDQIRAMLEA